MKLVWRNRPTPMLALELRVARKTLNLLIPFLQTVPIHWRHTG
jgi:hypothetical protein